jgi:hypothetical protein
VDILYLTTDMIVILPLNSSFRSCCNQLSPCQGLVGSSVTIYPSQAEYRALSCHGMPKSRVTNYLLPESETTVVVPRLRLTRFLLSKYARGSVVTRTFYAGMHEPIVTKYSTSISWSGMPRP